MGVPGPVDYTRGVPVSPPVMPGWDHYPVASHLTERFGCPAFLDNDVNVMALGERDRGAAQDVDDFMFVKIGTGIGCFRAIIVSDLVPIAILVGRIPII
jgi:predicted NBD/HSP70 family sugar kinase